MNSNQLTIDDLQFYLRYSFYFFFNSLDTTEASGLLVSSPGGIFNNDKIQRKTWNSAAVALDSLMLSNVCALSSRYVVLVIAFCLRIRKKKTVQNLENPDLSKILQPCALGTPEP